MSKILYLSCHSILEYEEVKLLHELGHEVFPAGAYVDPSTPHDDKRPAIPGMTIKKDWLEQYGKLAEPGVDGRDHLTKSFVDNFDIVIVMHLPKWISGNWEAIKHKRVVWRTIGQSVASTEQSMRPYAADGLEIVRYSPREINIPHFAGIDALIRFYKDDSEYGSWTGENKRIVTFAQSMKQRDAACNYTIFEKTTRPFSRHLFGPNNEGLDWTSGSVPFDQLKKEMRSNRAYFYTGTHPASYTLNFIEAWMTGTPLVAIGTKYGNAEHLRNHDLYEIPDLITHGVNGFISDDVFELRDCISNLFNDDKLARRISIAGRESAIKHFGKDMIKESWRKFLDE